MIQIINASVKLHGHPFCPWVQKDWRNSSTGGVEEPHYLVVNETLYQLSYTAELLSIAYGKREEFGSFSTRDPRFIQPMIFTMSPLVSESSRLNEMRIGSRVNSAMLNVRKSIGAVRDSSSEKSL
jgi:hypothetical protein